MPDHPKNNPASAEKLWKSRSGVESLPRPIARAGIDISKSSACNSKCYSPKSGVACSQLPSGRGPECRRSSRNASIRHVKIRGAVWRVITSSVDRLHYQAIGAWLQIFHFHLQPDGNHGTPFLNEVIGSHISGKENLLITDAFENPVTHPNQGRICRGHSRLIDFGVHNHFV